MHLRLVQKVLKFEFAIEVIIVFVKSIKKASSGIFTLLVSQLYELSYIYPSGNVESEVWLFFRIQKDTK